MNPTDVISRVNEKLNEKLAARANVVEAAKEMPKQDPKWVCFYGRPLARLDEDIALLKGLLDE